MRGSCDGRQGIREPNVYGRFVVVAKKVRQARRATIEIKNRPVDIVVGTNSRFEAKRRMDYTQMVEGEVERDGILLYERE